MSMRWLPCTQREAYSGIRVFHDMRFRQIQDLWITTLMLSTNCASQVCVGQKICEASFVSCTTSHFGLSSFLESIEYDFTKAMKIQTGNWMLT